MALVALLLLTLTIITAFLGTVWFWVFLVATYLVLISMVGRDYKRWRHYQNYPG